MTPLRDSNPNLFAVDWPAHAAMALLCRLVAATFGVALNKYKFIETADGCLDTVTTSVPGVFACGAATGPADLEDSVSSASAAAMKAITTLRKTSLAAS